MIKPAALVMAVVMVGVSAGTYYGLQLLPPGTIPPPIGRNPPEDVAPPGTKPTEVAKADEAAEPAPAPAAEEPLTEQDLAEDPAPEEAAPAQQAEAEPAAEAEPEPAPSPPPAAKAGKPAAESAAAEEKPDPGWGKEPRPRAAAKPAPEPADAPAEEPTQVAKADSPSAPVTPAKKKPEADVIKPWWPDPAKMPAEQLKLQYAGQVQGQQAIALLFSAPLNLDTLKQHAMVRSERGEAVGGQWELSPRNAALALYKPLRPGRYTVVLAPEIADKKGFMLGTRLQGPIYIQE